MPAFLERRGCPGGDTGLGLDDQNVQWLRHATIVVLAAAGEQGRATLVRGTKVPRYRLHGERQDRR
jgi:hypothetical protein